MLREFTASAPTVEEAKAKALLELGLTEDTCDLEIEVLVFPEKKKLGLFGGKNAEVRVSYDDGKPAPKVEKKPVEKKAEPKAEKKPAEKKAEPKAEKKPAEAKKPAKKAEKPAEKKAEKPAKTVKIDDASKEKTVAYVRDILSKMDVGEYTLEVKDIEGGFCISLTGDGLGVVIGRRGETLDALQYLVSLSYTNDKGFVRVVLDANDYRAKREKTLTALALKVADQVVEGKRNRSLEPMNPYERRVIHTAIQSVEGVTSWSVSDGSERRVIVGLCNEDGTPVDPDYNPMRRSNSRGRSGHQGDRRRGGRPRRDSARVESSAPTRDKRSDASDLPLFGRIDNK